jgi:hypothetical protein
MEASCSIVCRYHLDSDILLSSMYLFYI